MQTFIIQGSDLLERQKYLIDKSKGCELIHVFAEKSSITIKQVQDLSSPLSISANLDRVVWIEEANLLTIPAQNALLKMLEEPPAKTSFYLSVQSKTSLLPTIQSRSTTITLDSSIVDEDPSILQDLKVVMSLSPGDRLVSIKKLDRDASKHWLTQIEHSLRSKLQDPNLSTKQSQMLAQIASLTLSAHTQLDANCSVSLVTQNYYLLLPHTRSTK